MVNQIVQQPVPLILKKILKEKTQGELTIKSDRSQKSLFFHEGNLIFAKTNVIQERLGEILFKIGKIDRSQFSELLKLVESKAETEKIGKILVHENILTQRDLFFALLYQFRTIATSAFSISAGEWDFIGGMPRIPDDTRFNIELPGIITEGMNKMVNFSYFKNKYYYQAPRLAPIPESMSDFLSAYEINFYKELANYKNIPCEQIIEKLKMSEEAFWKKITLFHLLNVVEFSEISVDKETDKNVEEIIGLYDQLRAEKMDYYELLNLEKTATFAQIKDAYFNYAKKYHPDRVSSAPDPEIKDKANYVFAEINKAYDVLSNDDKKREYDGRGYKESSMEDSIQENLTEKARMLYRKGKMLYTQKKYWEASSMLDEATRLDNRKAAYFLLLGLCQMNLSTQKRMAEKNLQKAIELEHWNVEAFAALGILFQSENQFNRAEGFFRKALSINPDHALARKKLLELKKTKKSEKKSGFFSFGKSKK